jgi:hypothetical protein
VGSIKNVINLNYVVLKMREKWSGMCLSGRILTWHASGPSLISSSSTKKKKQ